MNAPVDHFLPDVQSALDRRNIAIQRVGVKSITHPVMVKTATGAQPSVATIDMTVRLPAHVKGTHMSRFLEVLQAHEEALSPASLSRMLDAMLLRLDADSGLIEMSMPYFLRKTAPVSGVESLLDYKLMLRAEQTEGRRRLTLQVLVPVTSLCPCSKEISQYGAHNQRSHITIAATLAPGAEMAAEELIALAERSASCELWGLLKRPDEKYVTERAYENPKFVEDLVRDIATVLNADRRIARYEVASENFESIHNHSAYAWIEGPAD
ncbi:GTP cyclohydrolase I [Noviherbaspirillum humi]|uniref:GTP cyclohydrolase FolE2 n=1 Tax=Noviherbaspirillum humi TaxID=1688639 RepID=A0A239BWH9_9BURK|nr:GTP cyclohydrolase FolE2 [Noviherbaspirillum humi]SNS11788.1 GTP cyclohydrolase I [Noviherbaspirillum humi]